MRRLIVTADDFGVGPATSLGILDLAEVGVVTSTVLLVNSPYAADGVKQWEQSGKRFELGWHPCLTMDAPVLPAERVPTLVGTGGRFHPLGTFLKLLLRGKASRAEIEAELTAQYRRFVELVGAPPASMNGHHHVHIFRPVGDVLLKLLGEQTPKPFVRRVTEPFNTLMRVPGVRAKRWVLNWLGRGAAKRQARAGFPGNDALLGITDPPFVNDPDFFARWLREARGDVCVLMVHPGHADDTLADRDGPASANQAGRRVREFELLSDPTFRQAVERAGFKLVPGGLL
jgi:predicted glycoside hydrolase/deacetylase ChbG (UPF0249 family)